MLYTKIFVTEYDDGRKCVALGDTEEDAYILTEDVSEGMYYRIGTDSRTDIAGLSILDPFVQLKCRNGELYDIYEAEVPLRNVLTLAHDAVDLYTEDGHLAKGVLVKCPLCTGVYGLEYDGSVSRMA